MAERLAFRIPEPPIFLDEPVIRQPPIGHIFTFMRDHFQDKKLTEKYIPSPMSFCGFLHKRKAPACRKTTLCMQTHILRFPICSVLPLRTSLPIYEPHMYMHTNRTPMLY